MLTKETLIKQIDSFPDKFTVDELIERLLIEKIETGIQQSKDQQTFSEKELEKEMKVWFK